MAARLWFSTNAAPVTPPTVGAEWEHNSQSVNEALLNTPDSTALTTTATTYDGADHLVDNDALHFRSVSPPLVPQNVAGTVKAQFQALQNDDTDHLFMTYKVHVCSNDGATQKEVLLAITRDNTEVPITTRTNRQLAATAITAADLEQGDRIVVEVGLGGTPVASGGINDHDGSIRYGCSASSGDLPENDAETGANFRPWMEFSGNLSWHDDNSHLGLTRAGMAMSVP